ncbi:Asparagine synthetase domain-containing protein C4F6.11c [Astathelohania contejeani]|uniref:Asparagine synthetase domain-containing protein C4F6.11c n=1 Tax=Astathelohania contejeani TaxID=164912 RepID=A0ABQ7I1L7_9MICR|nr:Asparagine synthetase domain-containing protein C4F6.11c [Thelohania contejeani]
MPLFKIPFNSLLSDSTLFLNGKIYKNEYIINKLNQDELMFLNEINEYFRDICSGYTCCIVKNGNFYFFKDDLGLKSLGYNNNAVSNYEFEIEANPTFFYKFNGEKILEIEKRKSVEEEITDGGDKYSEAKSNDYIFEFENLFSNSIRKLLNMTNDKVFILFSGGIDSFLVAFFTHKILKEGVPIYLINTTFVDGIIKSIDREMGLAGWKDLKQICTGREFILIENNVLYKECDNRKEYINSLVYPKCSLMDINIGMCLNFGAKKAKELGAKYVFLGSGADELFGGYFKYKNCVNLKEELKKDVMGIWERNLGRDDRVITSEDIESLLPFLDPRLIKLSYKLPANQLVREEETVINKYLLRCVLIKNGFHRVAKIKKTAMQYGSGIFKWEVKNRKLNEIQNMLSGL